MWKNSTARYGSLQVALHWLMLVLLVAVYAAMELRENFPKGSDPREFLKSLHFMLGISVLILVAVRIAARLSGPTPAIVWDGGPYEWSILATSGGIDEELTTLAMTMRSATDRAGGESNTT